MHVSIASSSATACSSVIRLIIRRASGRCTRLAAEDRRRPPRGAAHVSSFCFCPVARRRSSHAEDAVRCAPVDCYVVVALTHQGRRRRRRCTNTDLPPGRKKTNPTRGGGCASLSRRRATPAPCRRRATHNNFRCCTGARPLLRPPACARPRVRWLRGSAAACVAVADAPTLSAGAYVHHSPCWSRWALGSGVDVWPPLGGRLSLV